MAKSKVDTATAAKNYATALAAKQEAQASVAAAERALEEANARLLETRTHARIAAFECDQSVRNALVETVAAAVVANKGEMSDELKSVIPEYPSVAGDIARRVAELSGKLVS